MPVRLPTSSASFSTEIASMPIGVGPCAWSVPTAIITVSDFLKASSASIQDISRSRNFFTLSASSWLRCASCGSYRGAVCVSAAFTASTRASFAAHAMRAARRRLGLARRSRRGRVRDDRRGRAQPLIQVS